jgi:hypothetical protein
MQGLPTESTGILVLRPCVNALTRTHTHAHTHTRTRTHLRHVRHVCDLRRLGLLPPGARVPVRQLGQLRILLCTHTYTHARTHAHHTHTYTAREQYDQQTKHHPFCRALYAGLRATQTPHAHTLPHIHTHTHLVLAIEGHVDHVLPVPAEPDGDLGLQRRHTEGHGLAQALVCLMPHTRVHRHLVSVDTYDDIAIGCRTSTRSASTCGLATDAYTHTHTPAAPRWPPPAPPPPPARRPPPAPAPPPPPPPRPRSSRPSPSPEPRTCTHTHEHTRTEESMTHQVGCLIQDTPTHTTACEARDSLRSPAVHQRRNPR